ncbi:MAG: cation:proton antiporter [Chloroflexales bacterium]|nr:cation:proton antiporter [Chloroflexales bacterium]
MSDLLDVESLVLLAAVVAFAASFVRLARGPSLPDRVVALDLIAVVSAAFMCIYAIETGQAVFLDAAIVLALIVFLGTVAFAQYLERRAGDE